MVITAEVTNQTPEPLRVVEEPPPDIIKPYILQHDWLNLTLVGNRAVSARSRSHFTPGETRTYMWRCQADDVYSPPERVVHGIAIEMPVSTAIGQSPFSPVIVGVTSNPDIGGANARYGPLCADMVR